MNEFMRIGDICDILNGYAFKSSKYVADGIRVIRITNVQKGFVEDTNPQYYPVSEQRVIEKYMLCEGDLLMSLTGNVGRVGLLSAEMLPAALNQRVACIRIRNPAVIYKPFLFHLLNSDYFENKCILASQGVAQKNMSTEWLKEYPIPSFSMDKQMEIASIFDKIDDLIARRKEQVRNTDQAVKSRFIELFGDPERNPKKWPVVSITEIIRGKVSNGFFAKRDAYRNDGNVQVLGVANIVNRMYSNIEGLPRTNATQAEKEKYRVRYGDMLFCRSSLVAEGIGKASIVPQDTPQNVMFECHVIRLPLDLQKCVPEFVQELSTTPYFRKQIIAQSKTATMTTIGQDGIQKAAIILPPVERQLEFLRFVEQTDKSKYYSSLSFRYCQAAANTYRQEWMTCRTSDF